MLANTLELIGDFYINTGEIRNAIYSYSQLVINNSILLSN